MWPRCVCVAAALGTNLSLAAGRGGDGRCGYRGQERGEEREVRQALAEYCVLYVALPHI